MSVFSGCVNIEKIEISDDNELYMSIDDVIYSRDKTVLYIYPAGKADKEFEIPSFVTAIAPYAFSDCSKLESVTIGTNVTEIGDGAFKKCTSLRSISLPSNLTEIPGAMAYGCVNLETVVIPSLVANVGEMAFGDCHNLKSIYIDSVNVVYGILTVNGYGGILQNTQTLLINSKIIGAGEYLTVVFPNEETVKYGLYKYNSYSKHEHKWQKHEEDFILGEKNGFKGEKCTECNVLNGKIISIEAMVATVSIWFMAYMAVAPVLTGLIIFIVLKTRKKSKNKQ